MIDHRTALVLRSVDDGRWLATYDPHTAEQTLPAALGARSFGAAYAWAGFDGSTIDALMVGLLGVNVSPSKEAPSWNPKGSYSDWADGHHVTRTGLILQHAPRGAWLVAEPTPGW